VDDARLGTQHLHLWGIRHLEGRRSSDRCVERRGPARSIGPQRATAIFAINGMTGIGVLSQGDGRELSVPERLSLVGYDDVSGPEAVLAPRPASASPRAESTFGVQRSSGAHGAGARRVADSVASVLMY
jgi:hypothetical protein